MLLTIVGIRIKVIRTIGGENGPYNVSASQSSLTNKWEIGGGAGMEGLGESHVEKKWQGSPTPPPTNKFNM